MKPSMDIATRVSAELSRTIEELVNDPDREEPPTLGDVRNLVRRHTGDAERHDLRFHPQERASMLAEIEALVGEFGPEAPAIDFVAAKASEPLSRVIERVVEIARLSHRPTLGGVREAMRGVIACVPEKQVNNERDYPWFDPSEIRKITTMAVETNAGSAAAQNSCCGAHCAASNVPPM